MKLSERISLFKKLNKLKIEEGAILIKKLGSGVEGVVNLVKVNGVKLALKYNTIMKIQKLFYSKIKKENYARTAGLVEVISGKLINNIVLQKICPHFIINYKSITKEQEIYFYNEYLDSITLRDFFKQNKVTRELLFNILFQILVSLYTLKYQYNMIHADLHFNNILISKIPENGHWEYKLNGKKYYLPNLGYQIYLNDYGLISIKDKLGPFWQTDFFKNIKDTNKYELYDIFLIKLEMSKFLGNHFQLFFKEFDYYDYYDYAENAEIKTFPQNLTILNLIEFLFNKREVSDCKNNPWYCYNTALQTKLLDKFDLDNKVKISNNYFKQFEN